MKQYAPKLRQRMSKFTTAQLQELYGKMVGDDWLLIPAMVRTKSLEMERCQKLAGNPHPHSKDADAQSDIRKWLGECDILEVLSGCGYAGLQYEAVL
jgi:hypothetical protein